MDSSRLIIQKAGPQQQEALELLAPLVADSGGRRPQGWHSEPVAMQMWRTVKKRKWVVLAALVVVVTIAILLTVKTTPQYQASARLLINRQSEEIFGFKDVGVGGSEGLDWDSSVEIESQVRVIQSDTLALKVIHSLGLHKNPAFVPADNVAQDRSKSQIRLGDETQLDSAATTVLLKRFRDNLSVIKLPQTRMVDIRFLSPDPRLAAQIANSLANAYIEENYRAKYESTMQASEWLSRQLADLQVKVETSEEKLVRYQQQAGMVGLDEKQNTVLAKLDELNRQLTVAESDRITRETYYRGVASGDQEIVSTIISTALLEKLRGQQVDLQTQLVQLETQFGPSYPKVVELRNQLGRIDNNLRTETERVLGKLRTEYETALNREAMLRSAFEAQKREANELNSSTIQYNLLRREADSNRQLYEGLLQKLKEASVSAGLRSGNIRVIDVARVPLKPSKPNVPRNIGFGLLGGLLLAFSLAMALERLDTAVHTPEEAAAVASLPQLGVIPLNLELGQRAVQRQLRSNGTGDQAALGLVTHARPKSHITEAYRALRTSILLSSSGAPPKVIMVTSSLPQEGKTTTSVNTAIVLAQRGSRVLLVDADLRRPSVHSLVGVPRGQGLSCVLTGSAPPEELIQPTQIPNLFLLQAGVSPPNPAELLGSAVMRGCLLNWRNDYDHIVIDTPPALSVTDPVFLSVEVDAVVLVVRAGSTSKGALRRTTELFHQVGARVLGVVVNAMDVKDSAYSYGSYYYAAKYGDYYSDEPTS